jgi:hypothetical protein
MLRSGLDEFKVVVAIDCIDAAITPARNNRNIETIFKP